MFLSLLINRFAEQKLGLKSSNCVVFEFLHRIVMSSIGCCFDDLERENKECVLAIIKEIMDAQELRVERRSSSCHIPLPELQELIRYISDRIKCPDGTSKIEKLDRDYLDFRHSLYVSALKEAQALLDSMDGNVADVELLLTSEQRQQVQNIPSLQTEVNKPYALVATELRSSSHAFVFQHKRHLQQMGTIFCEELLLSEAEQALLLKYIHLHDWSKFLMPLYWTSPAPEKLLGGMRPAFSPQGVKAGVQQIFFDLVHVHEILEGSAKYGHHLKAARIIDTGTIAGANIVRLLNNGVPDRCRWIERMVDSMEATLTKRIISTTAPACMETQSLADPFLHYWFTHHVPSNANGLAEEDFITCMSLLFGDTTISTMADCFTNALAQTKSEIYTVLSTEQLVAQSCIYRRCAFLFAS